MFNHPYSRKLEAEADQVGLHLAAKVTLLSLFHVSPESSYNIAAKSTVDSNHLLLVLQSTDLCYTHLPTIW